MAVSTKKQHLLLLLSCAAWCCLAAAGDTLAERAIDGAIGSQYVYTANIPAPRIVSGSRKAVKTASTTGRELSKGVVRPDVTAAATAEELEAIEAAIARLELAAAQAEESSAAPNLRQRARAATFADSMPEQQKRSAASVSIASVQPAHTEEASEAAAESAAPDVKDLVAGMQATLASLESAGQDLSSPEVQAVLAEAGSVIGELEAQGKEQATAVAKDAQEQQQQQGAESGQKAHSHAVLPDTEAEDTWVKVQAGPAKDVETAAALGVTDHPEEVQQVLAELEAAIAAAEAAAAAGLQV